MALNRADQHPPSTPMKGGVRQTHILTQCSTFLLPGNNFFCPFHFMFQETEKINLQTINCIHALQIATTLITNQALKLLLLLKYMAQSLFPFFLSALLNLTVYVDESRAPLLCEVEKPAIFPSLRVRIIPLKTSQILAPCSLTLGLTTGVNYTFCFHFFHQTAYCPVREHTHAVHNTFQVSIAAFRSLHISDTQPLWEENVSPD